MLSDRCPPSSDLCLVPFVVRPLSSLDRHPSRSGALTQPGQDLEAGIAVSRREPNFSLETKHRTLGVATNTAVGALGIEAEGRQAPLQFLHFGKRHQPFAARERMGEWTIAADAVGEMQDSEGVGKCRVIAHYGGKILADQKRRATLYRYG